MTHPIVPVSQIVAALGGPNAIAAHLGCSGSNVRMWPASGIPAKHHGALVDMAKARKARWITYEVLRAATTTAKRHKPAGEAPRASAP